MKRQFVLLILLVTFIGCLDAKMRERRMNIINFMKAYSLFYPDDSFDTKLEKQIEHAQGLTEVRKTWSPKDDRVIGRNIRSKQKGYYICQECKDPLFHLKDQSNLGEEGDTFNFVKPTGYIDFTPHNLRHGKPHIVT